jgi:hypothetical protein
MSRLICGRCLDPLGSQPEGRCRCNQPPPRPVTVVARPVMKRKGPTPPDRRENIAQPRRPLGWTGDEPPLIIPEWRSLGAGEMSMHEASQHADTGRSQRNQPNARYTDAFRRRRRAQLSLPAGERMREIRFSQAKIDPTDYGVVSPRKVGLLRVGSKPKTAGELTYARDHRIDRSP